MDDDMTRIRPKLAWRVGLVVVIAALVAFRRIAWRVHDRGAADALRHLRVDDDARRPSGRDREATWGVGRERTSRPVTELDFIHVSTIGRRAIEIGPIGCQRHARTRVLEQAPTSPRSSASSSQRPRHSATTTLALGSSATPVLVNVAPMRRAGRVIALVSRARIRARGLRGRRRRGGDTADAKLRVANASCEGALADVAPTGTLASYTFTAWGTIRDDVEGAAEGLLPQQWSVKPANETVTECSYLVIDNTANADCSVRHRRDRHRRDRCRPPGRAHRRGRLVLSERGLSGSRRPCSRACVVSCAVRRSTGQGSRDARPRHDELAAPQARDAQRVLALGLVGVAHRRLRFRSAGRRRRRRAVAEVELVADELRGTGDGEPVERDADRDTRLRVGRPHPRLEPRDALGRRADADLRPGDRRRVPDLADRRWLRQDGRRRRCRLPGSVSGTQISCGSPDQRARRAVAQVDGVPPPPGDLPPVRIERRARGIANMLEPIPTRRRVRAPPRT